MKCKHFTIVFVLPTFSNLFRYIKTKKRKHKKLRLRKEKGTNITYVKPSTDALDACKNDTV